MTNKQLCNLCNSNEIDVMVSFPEFIIRKCRSCHLVFTELVELQKKSDALYSENYFREVHPAFFDEGSKGSLERIVNYRKTLKHLKSFAQNGKGLLLDVGCGMGSFLQTAKESGFDVEGIDVSEYAADQVRKKGFVVHQGKLSELSLAEQRYDVITAWDVFEHMDDPVGDMEKCNALLKNNGLLLILTTNENSLMPRLAWFLYKISFGLIKRPMALIHPIHHLYHYTQNQLVDLLRKKGFEGVYLEKIELPLATIEADFLKKIVLVLLYGIAKIIRQEYCVLVIAKKVRDIKSS